MAEENYQRLAAACLCTERPSRSGWGGARPGAGRKPGSKSAQAEKPPVDEQRECHACMRSFAPTNGRKHCEACSRRLRICRGKESCPHEKPKFLNGKDRLACYECVPKIQSAEPRKAYTARNPQPAKCAGCMGAIPAPKVRQKYCSAQCRNDSLNALQQQRKRMAYPPRKCQECGVAFSSLTGRSHFCSADCKTKNSYRVRPGSTHRRRAKKHGCDYSEVNKVKVFERDGWKCRLCGAATPKKLKGTRNDRAPELDHIVPLSLGGAHSYDNTQCACKRCNMTKSNRPMGQLHLGFGAI